MLHAEATCIHTDHNGICKFGSESSPGFDLVCAVIQDLVQRAPEFISSRWKGQELNTRVRSNVPAPLKSLGSARIRCPEEGIPSYNMPLKRCQSSHEPYFVDSGIPDKPVHTISVQALGQDNGYITVDSENSCENQRLPSDRMFLPSPKLINTPMLQRDSSAPGPNTDHVLDTDHASRRPRQRISYYGSPVPRQPLYNQSNSITEQHAQNHSSDVSILANESLLSSPVPAPSQRPHGDNHSHEQSSPPVGYYEHPMYPRQHQYNRSYLPEQQPVQNHFPVQPAFNLSAQPMNHRPISPDSNYQAVSYSESRTIPRSPPHGASTLTAIHPSAHSYTIGDNSEFPVPVRADVPPRDLDISYSPCQTLEREEYTPKDNLAPGEDAQDYIGYSFNHEAPPPRSPTSISELQSLEATEEERVKAKEEVLMLLRQWTTCDASRFVDRHEGSVGGAGRGLEATGVVC